MATVVTKAQLEANKKIGWYAKPSGAVFQIITIKPYMVRYIGRLETGIIVTSESEKE